MKWRYDGRCGGDFLLPDRRSAECNPDGEYPCCNLDTGSCGNASNQCFCDNCTDYSRIQEEWKDSGGKQKWRYDGKCGMRFPLPNGEASECDPDGENPCCNDWSFGECGNTTAHCSCSGCTDYKFINEWQESGRKKWRSDGKCGDNYTLPNRKTAECNPDGENPCCNIGIGQCGSTADHCGCKYNCIDYSRIKNEWANSGSYCRQKWRYDRRCGQKYLLPDGTAAECDPDGETPCCNEKYDGQCGNTTEHCSCYSCKDYKFIKHWQESGGNVKWRYDGKCGRKYPLPDRSSAKCNPEGDKYCCSDESDGQCGNSTEHCSCSGCTDYKFVKEWEESGKKQRWRNDGRCGSNYPLPNGTAAECNPDGKNPCCNMDIGQCGNTSSHCLCKYHCTDYSRIQEEWKDSGGKQKWRYDGKCGMRFPLPNGKASECDPDGENPCCNDWSFGECGNTTEHCSCYNCKDYKFIKDWEESRGDMKWRYDGKCGDNYRLPDGNASECDPDGDNPCCNNLTSGECGNTTEHCSCLNCTDYKFIKEWKESGGNIKWRFDRKCGNYYRLPDNKASQCNPAGDSPCCSNEERGECGNSTEHCVCLNCTDYSRIQREWKDSGGEQKWRYDRKCGTKYPLPDGSPAECDPDGKSPCCSRNWGGECGNTTEHCSCYSCVDFKSVNKLWRNDGRCGSDYPLPNGEAAECDPDGENPCCSWNGQCGNTTEHCSCSSCKDYKFIKDWKQSETKQRWRNDGRCGSTFSLPDGTSSLCNPIGENPCCNYESGYCGNIKNNYCADYSQIYKDWNESEGKRRWRYDRRCGRKFPLPDGTPSECDPDGKNPCCNTLVGICDGKESVCLSNVDYRVVKEVRQSGESCSVARLASGFLKTACYNESSFQQYFKCENTNEYYDLEFKYEDGNEQINVTRLCSNDPKVYQACGFKTQISSGEVLCGGYFCEPEHEMKHKYVNCTGEDCEEGNRACTKHQSSKQSVIPCDDKCDSRNCEDESVCNGFEYGLNCPSYRLTYNFGVGYRLERYVHPSNVCDKTLDCSCSNGADEKNCEIGDAVHTCTQSRTKENHDIENAVPILDLILIKGYIRTVRII